MDGAIIVLIRAFTTKYQQEFTCELIEEKGYLNYVFETTLFFYQFSQTILYWNLNAFFIL